MQPSGSAPAPAPRVLSRGRCRCTARLEQRLADFKGTEAALLFGSGYLANTGVVAALAGRGEVVFSDELNHASIIDGCRLSRAEAFVYRHRDTEHLEWGLRRAGGRAGDDRHRLRLLDGRRRGAAAGPPRPGEALLLHADGRRGAWHRRARPRWAGRRGGGGADGEVDVVVGTLGKALGGYGAYVCTRSDVAELLVNTARPSSTRPRPHPPRSAPRWRRWRSCASAPGLVEQLRRNARRPARGARAPTGWTWAARARRSSR